MRQQYLCVLLIAVAALFEGCGGAKPLTDPALTREQIRMQALQQKVKELERDGWKADDASRTLQLCLLDLEDMKAKGSYEVIEGDVSMCRSLNICKTTALTNAQNQLAQRLRAQVTSKVVKTEGSNNDSNLANPVEKDNMEKISRIESRIDLSGLLLHCYARYRMLQNGSREYKATYVYDSNRMSSSVEKAVREADLEDTQRMIEKGKSVDEYLNQ